MHALIIGPVQVGKSTLIQKILNRINRPVWGFTTKKESSIFLKEFGHPVYIYDPVMPPLQTEENRNELVEKVYAFLMEQF